MKKALALSAGVLVSAALGFAAGRYTAPDSPKSGTWVCVSPTGQVTPVDNIANCGEDDLTLYCLNWVTAADGTESCAPE